MRFVRTWLAVLVALSTVVGVFASPAGAWQTPQDGIVLDNPVNNTPNVLNGEVDAVLPVGGNRVLVGGTFTQVQQANSTTTISRTNIFAFNRSTGAIDPSFSPSVNGQIHALVLAEDGTSVYVGGLFNSVNGTTRRGVARISVTTGANVSGFTPPSFNGGARDLVLVGTRLYVGGTFTTANSLPRNSMATINATTGALDPFLDISFADPHNGGAVQVLRFDVTPDARRLVAIGNFHTVGGLFRPQIVMVDLTGDRAVVANWQTLRYADGCNTDWNTYMRDVDFSPDGSWFVVVATAGYRFGRLCDTAARWETEPGGTGLQPSWVDWTGGDTLTRVAITGDVVYVGGHNRWFNNPFAGNTAGPGAVPVNGIAALDARNGLPFDWFPGRSLGKGVFALTPDSTGLWMGSDTTLAAGEYRARLAYWPLAGGDAIPPDFTGALPGLVYQLSSLPAGASDVSRRTFDGTTAGTRGSVDAGTTAWSSVRGAMMVDGALYTGSSDGTFRARSFDGTTAGPDSVINLYGGSFAADLPNLTSMFFLNGRIYYTVAGQSKLFYRWFTPQSRIVGAERFEAHASNITGLDFRTVSGMFTVGGTVYYGSSSDGRLRRATFTNGRIVPSSIQTVGTATDWRARGLFLLVGAVPDNVPPTADIDVTCVGLSCSFDGSGSQDPDGGISTYTWNFGDGTTGSGVSPVHPYAQAGTYVAALTVRDSDGATDTVNQSVTVTGENVAPTASFTARCVSFTCTFDGSGSNDPDGTLTAYEWDFGDDQTGSGATVNHTYASSGTFTVSLTVRDNALAQASATRQVTVPVLDTISFRGASSANRNALNHTVNIPGNVVAGDTMLLFGSFNSATPTVTGPTGWTQVSSVTSNGMITYLWRRTAATGDAGRPATAALSSAAKGGLSLLAYAGVDTDVPLAAVERAGETTSRATHTTPTSTVPAGAHWVVSYWADKTSATTAWTPPVGQVLRDETYGAPSGHVTTLATDHGVGITATTVGGLTATADAAANKATMWTVVLNSTS